MSLKAEDLDLKGAESVIFYTDVLKSDLVKRYNYPVSVDDNIKLENYSKVPSMKYDKSEDISFEYNIGLHESYISNMLGFMNSELEVYKYFHHEEYSLRCKLTGYLLPLIYLSKQYVSLEDSLGFGQDNDDKDIKLVKKDDKEKKQGYSFIRKNTDYIGLKNYTNKPITANTTLAQSLTY